MRISIFGNCQAQVMRSIVKFACPGYDVPDYKPNYMVNESDIDAIITDMNASDFVFVQRVSEDFKVERARSSKMRAEFESKIQVWPNIYFDGYYPDVRYVYLEGWGKLKGPLDDYHFDRVIRAYRQGLPPSAAAKLMESDDVIKGSVDPFALSLASLREREAEVDVPISDFLQEHLFLRPCFFTPNHPETFILVEMCKRLFARSGVAFDEAKARQFGGALNFIRIPMYPAIYDTYALPFDCSRRASGVRVDAVQDLTVSVGESCSYDWEELVTCFYNVYSVALT